jgi:hypothetical protein
MLASLSTAIAALVTIASAAASRAEPAPDAAPEESPITAEEPAREPVAEKSPTEKAPDRPARVQTVDLDPEPKLRAPKLRRYLTRDVAPSARFLDHGVVELSFAGGYPHRYRLGLALGLFDHLTIGGTVHWLPKQSRPRFAPRIAIAFYRWRWLEFGALYDRSLYPPPAKDLDAATLSFQRDAHWLLAAFAFSHAWLSAGFEIGAVRARVRDPAMPDADEAFNNPSKWRYRFGGGAFIRGGTRRWGFFANARAPWVFAELGFDLRFGAFELRPRGGWRPEGVVRTTDRRVPTRR